MNGNGTTRIEQFNQLIRGAVVLALVFGMIYGFIWSKVVSTESFMIVAILVFNWWFKSRDEDKKASDTVDVVKAAAVPSAVALEKAEARAAKAEEKVAATPGVTITGGSR